MLRACSVDIELLRKNLKDYIENELDNLVVEGQADAIDHERTGLLVEPDSLEALAAALRRVLEDRAAADAMGREAAAHVAAHFTAAGMAARYAAVYDGC